MSNEERKKKIRTLQKALSEELKKDNPDPKVTATIKGKMDALIYSQ